ncbi:restriction endonuclease subunit S [Enterobacter sp. BNK-16]|uniref:restriction endonuclease subunit S n=1 Tax=Enterobacter sp. BNK-16 TaxID=3376153 RepID=UPI003B51348D
MVPKIRFQSFSTPLVKYKVEDILERFTSPVLVNKTQKYREIGIRSHGRGLFHKDEILGSELGSKRVFWVKKDALILNIVFAWEQAIALTSAEDEGFIASHRFPMYYPKENKCNIDYIRRYFLTKKGKSLLESASPGGAGRNKTLGQKNFNELVLSIPDILEQTKIADFLNSVDEIIKLVDKQHALLSDYKKGVIQKIFSQELRFKDDNGKAFPEWKIKSFRTLYSLLGTNSLSRNELNYENGIVKNIHYGDIHTKFNCLFDINKELVPYISKEIKITEDNLCRKGDLVIADASEDYNDIGKCIEIVNVGQQQIVAGLHTFLARPSTNMALGFGSYMMQSSEVRKQIKVIATGVSVLSVTKKNLLELMLPLPSIGEQTKIANFLATIDDKIILKKAELDKLTTWKQALIQKMFV